MKQVLIISTFLIAVLGLFYFIYILGENKGVCINPTAHQMVGLIYCNSSAEAGFILFQPISSNSTFLIDVEGRQINSWKSDPLYRGIAANLFPNGDIVRISKYEDTGDDAKLEFKNSAVILERISWDNSLKWSVTIYEENFVPHSNLEILSNGNILILASKPISNNSPLAVETLLEIKVEENNKYKIVWEQDLAEIDNLQHDQAQPQQCNKIKYDGTLDQVNVICDKPSGVYMIDRKSSELFYRNSQSELDLQQLPNDIRLLRATSEPGVILQIDKNNEEVWRYVVPVGIDGNIISRLSNEEFKISPIAMPIWYSPEYLDDFLFDLYSDYYDDYAN